MKKVLYIFVIIIVFILGSCTNEEIQPFQSGDEIEQYLLSEYNNKEINMSDFKMPTILGDTELTIISSNRDVVDNEGNLHFINSSTDIILTVQFTFGDTDYSVALSFKLIPNFTDQQIVDFIINEFEEDISSGQLSHQFTYFSNVIEGAEVTLYTSSAPSINDSTGMITFPSQGSSSIENTFDLVVSYGNVSSIKTFTVEIVPLEQTPQEIFEGCISVMFNLSEEELFIDNEEEMPNLPLQIVCDGGFKTLEYTTTNDYFESSGVISSRPDYLSGNDTQLLTLSTDIMGETVYFDYLFTLQEAKKPKIKQMKTAVLQNDKYFSTAAILYSIDDSSSYTEYVFTQMNETLIVKDTTNLVPIIDMIEGESYLIGGILNTEETVNATVYIDEVIDINMIDDFRTGIHSDYVNGFTGTRSDYGPIAEGGLDDSGKAELFDEVTYNNVTISFESYYWIDFAIKYVTDYDSTSTVNAGFDIQLDRDTTYFNDREPFEDTGYILHDFYNGTIIVECDSIEVKYQSLSFYSEDELRKLYYQINGCKLVLSQPEEKFKEIQDFNTISDGESIETAGIVTELNTTNDIGVMYVDGYSFDITGDLSNMEVGTAYVVSGSKVNSSTYSITSSDKVYTYNDFKATRSHTTSYIILTYVETTSYSYEDSLGRTYSGIESEMPHTYVRDDLLVDFSIGDMFICTGKLISLSSPVCMNTIKISSNIYIESKLSSTFNAAFELNELTTEGEYSIIGEIIAYDTTNQQITVENNGQTINIDVNQDCNIDEYCFLLSNFSVGNIYAFDIIKNTSGFKLKFVYSPTDYKSVSDSGYYFAKIDMSNTYVSDDKIYLTTEEEFLLADEITIGYTPYLEIDLSDNDRFLNSSEVYVIVKKVYEKIDSPLQNINQINTNTRFQIKGYEVTKNYNILFK